MDTKKLSLLLLVCASLVLASTAVPTVTASSNTPAPDLNEQTISDDLLNESGQVEARIALDGHSNTKDTIERVEQHISETDHTDHTISYERTHSIIVDIDTDSVDWENLASHDDIEAIYKNERLTTPTPPEESGNKIEPESHPETQYGIKAIGADKAWKEFGTKGDGVKVAVIDSGLDTDHPSIDLGGDPENNYKGYWAVFNEDIQTNESLDFEGKNAPAPTDIEDNYHGTHVSGTVIGGNETGTQIGVAPNATLMHASGYYNDTGPTSEDIIRAIEWAMNNDADIITMSLGYPNYEGGAVGDSNDFLANEVGITEEIQSAKNNGTIFFTSAGNTGDGSVSLPAADGESVSIGASTSSNNIADYSSGLEYKITDENWGNYKVANEWESPLITPDFAAPGNNIYSARADSSILALEDGTSMASPHAAGSTALLLENNPTLEPDEIYTAYQETATKPPETQDTRYGHGIINTYEAIKVSKQNGYVTTVDTSENDTVVPGDTLLVEANHTNTNIFDEQATRNISLYINNTVVADNELTLDPRGQPNNSRNTTFEYTVREDDIGEEIILSTEDQNTTIETTIVEAAKFEPTIISTNINDPLTTGTNHTIPVEVKNVGGSVGIGNLDLYVNGSLEIDGDYNIPKVVPGETKTINLEYTPTKKDKPKINLTAQTNNNNSQLDRNVVEPPKFKPSLNTSTLGNGLVIGKTETISAKIENVGGLKNHTTVDLFINGTKNQSTQTDSINPNENGSVEFDYTPTNSDIPELNISVKTPDETTNETVNVLVPGKSKLNITETNSPIESKHIETTIEVENVGETEITDTLSVKIAEIGENSTEISVGPSEKITETLSIPTSVGDNGEYTLEVLTQDDTIKEQVSINKQATYKVEIADITKSTTVGENFSVKANITNVGDEKATQQVEFSDNGSSSPFNSTTVTLGPGEDTQVKAERKTTLNDPEEITIKVITEHEKSTDTITINPPKPPKINSVTIAEDKTNDVATITTDYSQGGVDIAHVKTELKSDFTSFSDLQTNNTGVSEGGKWVTTFDTGDLPSDGNYTAYTTIEDETGQIVNAQGESVEMDTSPPSISLSLDNLGTDDNAELSISADEKYNITSLTVEDNDGNVLPTSAPSDLQSGTTIVKFDDNNSSEFDTTLEVEDDIGNSVSETISGSVSDYTINNGTSKITTPNNEVQVKINVNESKVNEGEQRKAVSSLSDSLTTGTTADSDQLINGVFDVRDIGLSDDELESATLRFSVNLLSEELTKTFENNELKIMRSEDGESNYTPIQTKYDSDTKELVATVNGFSQHAIGGEDNTPPSIDNTTVTPETQIEEKDGPVTVKFEYSPDGTDIDLSKTDITASNINNSQIKEKQITDKYGKIEIKDLKSGNSTTVELTVTDKAGNQNEKSITIEVKDPDKTNKDEQNNNSPGGSSESSGGSGSGGGSGGGGGRGGDGITSANPTEIPSDVEMYTRAKGEVRTDGNNSISNPGDFLTNPVISTVIFDKKGIKAEIEVRDYNTTPDRAGDPPGEIITAHEIIVPHKMKDYNSTLQFELSRIEDPQKDLNKIDQEKLTVWSESNGKWTALETTVVEGNNGSVVLKAETDSYSHMAVTTRPTEEPPKNNTQDEENTPDGSTTSKNTPNGNTNDEMPGFGIITAFLSITILTTLKKYSH